MRELLRDQHPDLAERHIAFGAQGWDNQLWRLGDNLAVRLPWKTGAADSLLMKEHAWVPMLAPQLPLPVPVPLRLGRPSDRYPRPWIITTWVPGAPADVAPATQGEATAVALAEFLTALHVPAPTEAPTGGYGRGGPLARVAVGVQQGFDSLEAVVAAVSGGGRKVIVDPDAVRIIWDDAMRAPEWEGPAVWLHGDLHPANVLTTDGVLCGIVDFGDLCAGDPALDLAAPWILLPDTAAVASFRRHYQLPAADPIWRRARGWAVWRALGSLSVAVAGDPGGKPSWGPPAVASLERLIATIR